MPLDLEKLNAMIPHRGQADLARRMGTSEAYISRMLRGQIDPKLSTVDRLAKAMGISLAEIWIR